MLKPYAEQGQNTQTVELLQFCAPRALSGLDQTILTPLIGVYCPLIRRCANLGERPAVDETIMTITDSSMNAR